MNSLFPSAIAADPWVLYHDTSNLSESEIDATGLHTRRSSFDESELRSVLAPFKHLNWYGRTGASRNVLEAWSINFDLAHPRGKPLYLAEAASRAAVHGGREFAGGEAAYAVRHSIDDLEAYVSDVKLRIEHRELIQSGIDYLRENNADEASFPSLPPENLEWLELALRDLVEIRTRARTLHERFEYGVVYATRIEEQDLAHLS